VVYAVSIAATRRSRGVTDLLASPSAPIVGWRITVSASTLRSESVAVPVVTGVAAVAAPPTSRAASHRRYE
jgi:hypothetical protein